MNYFDSFASDSERLIEVAEGNESASIVYCDNWSVTGLCDHVSEVFGLVAANIGSGQTEKVAPEVFRRPESEAPVAWFTHRYEALAEKLKVVDPDVPNWSFHPEQKTAAFWLRRMMSEIAIHRFDVETAAGQVTPIPTDTAIDIVSEYMQVGLLHSARRPNRVYPQGSLHLHCIDGPGEWTLRTGDDGQPIVSEEHTKGDAAVRGTGQGLALFIWGRPTSDIEQFGDAAVAAAWQDVAP